MPGPSFEVVEDNGRSYWEVVILDNMSDDNVHFETKGLKGWTPEDIAIAGGRECQEGNGVVSVRKFDKGLPIFFKIYRVQYAWNRWNVQAVS